MKPYACSYYHKGVQWCLEVIAEDEADARARLVAIGRGKVDGELVAKIPAAPGAGLLVRLITTVRNTIMGGR